MSKRLYLILTIISISFFVLAYTAKAEDFFELSRVDYQSGSIFEFYSPAKELGITFSNGPTNQSFLLKAMMLASQDMIGNYFSYPDNIVPASDLYLIKWPSINPQDVSLLTEIKVKYNKDDKYKEVYYYDWSSLSFQKIDSTRDELKGTLSFYWPENKKSLMFAVFNEPEIVGAGSWYVHPKYKNELMAASRDFQKGSVVRVTNLDNGKEVIVTIKDYGPKRCADWTEEENRLMGPCQERILDLSKKAFASIASVYQGIIPLIKVTPVL